MQSEAAVGMPRIRPLRQVITWRRGPNPTVQEAQSSSLVGNLRLGPERLCGRSADRKNCELFGATARGQPVQPTLDMADVAWGSGVRMGA